MNERFNRRSVLGVLASVSLPALAGCNAVRSDDGLDVVIENLAATDHEVRVGLFAAESFEETATIDPGGQITFEDAVPYPDRPQVAEYNVELVDFGTYEQGTFALSDELVRFGWRISESDGGAEPAILTLKDYRESFP